ncbi:hypothetical protein [Sulfurovum sp.]|jgi:hypothetical protein|uniref:hypothetical protein n=1 Tax=Sulfurovum sp. TaxID=1969726 RepID=UPI002A361F65|nr:hypothetical protein [Sulfurovum sp.]MDY0402852.1 hypothetical protein [Sulfurovum sp.]
MKYIAAILAFVFLVFLVKVGVDSTAKKSSKSVRLECHNKSTVFERVYDQALMKEVQRALQKGEYELLSRAKKAQYMKSRLFEHVDMEEVDQMVKSALTAYKDPAAESNASVTVDYFVYENDKEDPGKKTKESKRFAGYLHFKVMSGGERVYVIQIDFMDLKGKDIPEKVECAVQSIMTAS